MKALQTILGAILLTLTASCEMTPAQGQRVNRRASDTSSVESGELLLQRDSTNGVNCYHRYLADGIACVRDAAP